MGARTELGVTFLHEFVAIWPRNATAMATNLMMLAGWTLFRSILDRRPAGWPALAPKLLLRCTALARWGNARAIQGAKPE